jgi:hypothetical protein
LHIDWDKWNTLKAIETDERERAREVLENLE